VWANEIDSYCADWLRNLFPGITVDERSIVDLGPADVTSDRAHFFAGIGGWEYALQLAGWPADREVWTGSCPCQPLSGAGRRKGHADERHLWPAFYRLIAECRPATVFGEQVASDLGREWLAGVRADLEGLGYAVGCADLCAAGAGAPHIRQRLFWVADDQAGRWGEVDSLDGGSPQGNETEGSERSERGGGAGGVALAEGERLEGRRDGREGLAAQPDGLLPGRSGEHVGAWDDAVWIDCLDGKKRRIESGLEPLAHGVPARASKLRAYGNAICPQVAAAFIRAYLQC
jgi:DNA (cytosine-5)-methyltransferase 1